MAQTAYAKPSERASALIIVLLLHVIAVVLLLYHRWPVQPPSLGTGPLTVVSLNAEPAAPTTPTAPPPPLMPSEIQEVIEAQAQAQALTEASATAGAPGAACATLELVRNAILADPAAVASILNSPPHTRSIAEAVVLWNTRWIESAGFLSSPLGATRAAVERSLASLDEGCLNEPITGPRLIPIPAGTGTMFVVFGSGTWTWGQVDQDRSWAPLPPENAGWVGERPKPTSLGGNRPEAAEFQPKG